MYQVMRCVFLDNTEPYLKQQLRVVGFVTTLTSTEGLLRFSSCVYLYLRDKFFDVAPNLSYLDRLSQGVVVKLKREEVVKLHDKFKGLHGV